MMKPLHHPSHRRTAEIEDTCLNKNVNQFVIVTVTIHPSYLRGFFHSTVNRLPPITWQQGKPTRAVARTWLITSGEHSTGHRPSRAQGSRIFGESTRRNEPRPRPARNSEKSAAGPLPDRAPRRHSQPRSRGGGRCRPSTRRASPTATGRACNGRRSARTAPRLAPIRRDTQDGCYSLFSSLSRQAPLRAAPAPRARVARPGLRCLGPRRTRLTSESKRAINRGPKCTAGPPHHRPATPSSRSAAPRAREPRVPDWRAAILPCVCGVCGLVDTQPVLRTLVFLSLPRLGKRWAEITKGCPPRPPLAG